MLFSKHLGKSIIGLSIVGETIFRIEVDKIFEYGSQWRIDIKDAGQECCEHRYMHTDDDLEYFVGAKLLGVECRSAEDRCIYGLELGACESCERRAPDEDCYANVQFLVVTTTLGAFTIANYNAHNGYYAGFDLSSTILYRKTSFTGVLSDEWKMFEDAS